MSPGGNGTRGITEILLVEDSLGAVRLMEEALKESQEPIHLSVVRDGQEAMGFLRQQGDYANAVRPDLILLDLNLPKKNGFEVLAEIRQDAHLKDISVIVMTSSANPLDIRRAYALKANCCLTKSIDLEPFFKLVKALVES
jgi:two-component system, chemotaxis family, response regulator Rcp1